MRVQMIEKVITYADGSERTVVNFDVGILTCSLEEVKEIRTKLSKLIEIYEGGSDG